MSSPTGQANLDPRIDLAAAAERRLQSSSSLSSDVHLKHEHEIRQRFRRLLDPGIVRPNGRETTILAMKTLETISGNLLRDPENPKFQQFKPTNTKIKQALVEPRGALEYAIELGFRAEVQNFQPLYVFNWRKATELRIGHEVVLEAVEREMEKLERSKRVKEVEKAAHDAATKNVKLAFEDDRKTKMLRDQMEREIREARVTAAATRSAQAAIDELLPLSSSPPTFIPGRVPSTVYLQRTGPNMDDPLPRSYEAEDEDV